MNRRVFIIAAVFIVFTVTLFSSCAEKYELSITGLTGGSVSLSPADGAYSEGTRVTLTAAPSSGYAFTGWGNTTEYSADNTTSKQIEIIMPPKSISISAGFTVPGEGWLFMVYMAGDNTLSNQVLLDIDEIEKGLYEAKNAGNTAIATDVKVVILSDRSGSTDTRLYFATPDNNSGIIASRIIVDGGYSTTSELNMAEPDTLEDFISYAMTKYPSQYNALVMWNHGGGVKNFEAQPYQSKGICEDNGEIMYLNEVQTAVGSAIGAGKLNVFGMDACIMGEVETAYEMRNLTDYFVASAANELGYGWGYSYIFNKFTVDGSPPAPAAMADILVTQFRDSTPSLPHYDPDTMVAVKTSELEGLKTAIDALAAQVYSDGAKTAFEAARNASVYYRAYDSAAEVVLSPYYDIFSFCSEIETSGSFSTDAETRAGVVKNALASAVVACYGNSSNFDSHNSSWPNLNLDYYAADDASALRGLSFLIPHGELSYDSKPNYSYLWWYSSELYNTTSPGIVLGGIDFCTFDDDGSVETWRELFEAWYDDYPAVNVGGTGQGYTPGKF